MKKFIFISIVIICTLTKTSAQWVNTYGPAGGVCNSLVVIHSKLFVGSTLTTVSFPSTGIFVYDTVYDPNVASCWHIVDSTIMNSFQCLAKSGDELYAGTSYGGQVFRSENDGTSWVNISNGLPENKLVLCLDFVPKGTDSTYIFAGIWGEGVYRSIDNGANWKVVKAGLTNTLVSSLTSIPDGTDRSTLFAGTYGGGVFRSANYGESWTAVNNGLDDLIVNAFAAYSNGTGGTNLFVAVGNYASGGKGGVYLSKNTGESWTAVNNGLKAIYALSFTSLPNGAGGTNLIAGSDSGVFISFNNGLNWSPFNKGFKIPIFSLTVFGENLFAGVFYQGVFMRPLSDMTMGIGEPKSGIPENRLQQNFPNPFNNSTTINYEVKEQGVVTMKIIDLMGKEVANLVNEQKVKGEYSVEWNAAGLAGGIYFCRLQTGSFSETTKLIFQK